MPEPQQGQTPQGIPPGFSAAPKSEMPSDAEIRQMATERGLDPDIISKQVRQESGGKADAVSSKGAIGPMQLMPHTAEALGVDPHDPVDNLHGGMTLMQQLLTRYGGDYEKALAAYNAGPIAVDKHGGVPPYPETQNYVSSILGEGIPTKPTEAAKPAATGLPAGFTASIGEAPAPVSPTSAATSPPAAPETGVLASLRQTVGAARGIYHALSDDATDQEIQHFKDQHAHMGLPYQPPSQTALAWYRLFEQPADLFSAKGSERIEHGVKEWQNDNLGAVPPWLNKSIAALHMGSGAADKALAYVPALGPVVNAIATKYERGDTSGAATDIATAWALEHAPSLVKQGASKVAQQWDVAKAANLVDQSGKDITAAMPPTKSAPYTPENYREARVHLEDEHRTAAPINSIEQFRDAADTRIGKIEDFVAERIAQAPNDELKVKPLNEVQSALSKNPRGDSFAAAGLKELEDFKLDEPKTVGEADSIRRQLNAENKAVLKKNNYDVATARAVDPGFAAREVAAESIRHGLYDALKDRGTPGLDALRGEEGSLIKMRNAAQAQIFKGDQVVASASGASLPRRIAARVAGSMGAGVGASVAGVPGAVAGAEIGGEVGNAIAPKMTRDALIKRSFETQTSDFLGYPKGRVQALPEEAPRPTIGSAGPLFNQPTETGENLPGTRPQHVTEGAPPPTEPVGTQLPLRPQPPGPPSPFNEPQQGKLFNERVTLKGISERLKKPFVKNPESGVLKVGGTSPNASGESAASQEAINRPGVAYKVGPSGITYLGKDIDANLKPGEAVIRHLPDGTLRVHNTNGMTDKIAIARYGQKVLKARLKGE